MLCAYYPADHPELRVRERSPDYKYYSSLESNKQHIGSIEHYHLYEQESKQGNGFQSQDIGVAAFAHREGM